MGICSTLVNLKAVIFPHRNYYNNDNSKNNRGGSGYHGDSMVSRLILYASLTVKTATYWDGFSYSALFHPEIEAVVQAINSLRVTSCQEMGV